MPRSAPRQPDVFGVGMPVEDKVRVRRVLVLAHPGLDQGGSPQCRKAEFQVVAGRLEARGGGHARAGGWVKRGSADVGSDLEAPPFIAGNAVELARPVVDPDREAAFQE